ncbi:MAG: hypothetical protein WD991_02355 [Candidatus Paceibacterota bacterium]
MAKKIMQDVVKKKAQKIERLQPKVWDADVVREPRGVNTLRGEERMRIVQKNTQSKTEPQRRDKIGSEMSARKPKSPRRYGLWMIAIVAVLFLLFALSFLFSKALIVINPKTEVLALENNFSAIKDPSTAGASFDLVIISGQETLNVTAEEEREVRENAQGKVILYNNFGSTPQRLSIDTRLEGSNGKIYKTTREITIPGLKSDNSPGSVEVDIYGAEPGPSYNSEPLDFKIFGFKGTPKYEKFYARSKGPIAGGLIGKLPFVTPALKASTSASLKDTLKAKLFKKISDQTPSGFILFKDAAILNITEESVDYDGAKEGSVPIVVKGTLYGLLLNEEKLTKEIARKAIKDHDGSDVYIVDIAELNFALTDKENISFSNVKNINFSLSGEAKFIWKVNEEEFMDSILGQPKSSFNSILSNYSNIDSADLSLRPFWRMSLPEDPEGLEIIVNNP